MAFRSGCLQLGVSLKHHRDQRTNSNMQQRGYVAQEGICDSRNGLAHVTHAKPPMRVMPLSAALYENADTGTLFSGDDLVGLATVLKRIERIESALQELIQPRVTSRVVGSLKLDLIKRTANRGERPIELRPREYSLLDYMMQRTNEVLTRARLFKEVLNYKFVPSANLVDVHMGRLRRKVDMPNEAPMIECIRGAGFMLRAPV